MKLNRNTQVESELCEACQKAVNTYALANVDIKKSQVNLLSTFFKCRDYLGDSVFQYHTDVPISKYGWNTDEHSGWKGEAIVCWWEVEKDLLETRIHNLNVWLMDILDLPPFYMERLDFDGSMQVQTDPTRHVRSEAGQVYLVNLDPYWIKSVAHMSLATAILRFLWHGDVTLPDFQISENEEHAYRVLTRNINEYDKTLWEKGLKKAMMKQDTNALNSTKEYFDEMADDSNGCRHNAIHNSSGINNMYYLLTDIMEEGGSNLNMVDYANQGANTQLIHTVIEELNND